MFRFTFLVSFFCLYVQPDYDVGQNGLLREAEPSQAPKSLPKPGFLKRFFRCRRKPEATAELDYVNGHNMQAVGNEGYYNNKYPAPYGNFAGMATPESRPGLDPFGTSGLGYNSYNSYGKSSSQGVWDGNS